MRKLLHKRRLCPNLKSSRSRGWIINVSNGERHEGEFGVARVLSKLFGGLQRRYTDKLFPHYYGRRDVRLGVPDAAA